MKYIIITVVLLIILFTYNQQVNQKESPIVPLNPQDTILAFGDSLTYGYNAKPSESYPVLLSNLTHLKVINAGIPAESSQDGLKRLPKLLEDKSIKLMILFFGGNDIMQGLSVASLKKNLKTMVQMAKERNVEVLLISVPNLSLFGLSPLDLYEEVSEEENLPLLSDMLANIISNSALKSDQIHPNALGYKIMGEEIYKSIKENGWVK